MDRKEACASTPTGDLAPYSSEYEGYMTDLVWLAGRVESGRLTGRNDLLCVLMLVL